MIALEQIYEGDTLELDCGCLIKVVGKEKRSIRGITVRNGIFRTCLKWKIGLPRNPPAFIVFKMAKRGFLCKEDIPL